MFFSLSKTKDLRFFHHHQLGDWYLSVDEGWQNTDNNVWKKGYNHPAINHGNWMEIRLEKNIVYLDHDRHRSFPLWWDDEQKMLTNLLGQGRSIWADKKIKLVDSKLHEIPHDYVGDLDLSPISSDKAVDLLFDNLLRKFRALDKDLQDYPKKLFLTGGIDTLTLGAFVKHCDIKVESLNHTHFDFCAFTDYNLDKIKIDHWGYTRTNHWREPCVLLSGSCGDEYNMRGPDILAIWAAWHDIDIVKYLSTAVGYHVWYFNLPHNTKKFTKAYSQREEIKSRFPNYDDLVLHLLDINANDHQHWHLGNTMMWTPFKDLDIFKIYLRLSPDQMMEQISAASVSCELIKRTCPDMLKGLSTSKNLNQRENLHRLAQSFIDYSQN